MAIEISEIPVQILSLQPGQVLLVRVPWQWSDKQRSNLGEALVHAGLRNIVFVPDTVSLAVADSSAAVDGGGPAHA